jgi:NAD(P)-dependent dehydrogenase (short-subunit alcohol dehydrogenase family)
MFVACDVGDASACGALVDAALEWAGRLDVLVNNAAVVKSGDFLELSPRPISTPCSGSTSRVPS